MDRAHLGTQFETVQDKAYSDRMTTESQPSEPPPLLDVERPAAEPPAQPTSDTTAAVPRASKSAPRQNGGRREGSGRKAKPRERKLGHPAYVSMTDAEYRRVEKWAAGAELSVSAYIRKRLGLSLKNM